MSNFRITTPAGRIFSARLIFEGDRYGATNSLVHDRPYPLVEINDITTNPDGQHVARYFVPTILATPVGLGLNMHGGVPEWQLDPISLAHLAQWIRREVDDAHIAWEDR